MKGIVMISSRAGTMIQSLNAASYSSIVVAVEMTTVFVHIVIVWKDVNRQCNATCWITAVRTHPLSTLSSELRCRI